MVSVQYALKESMSHDFLPPNTSSHGFQILYLKGATLNPVEFTNLPYVNILFTNKLNTPDKWPTK